MVTLIKVGMPQVQKQLRIKGISGSPSYFHVQLNQLKYEVIEP